MVMGESDGLFVTSGAEDFFSVASKVWLLSCLLKTAVSCLPSARQATCRIKYVSKTSKHFCKLSSRNAKTKQPNKVGRYLRVSFFSFLFFVLTLSMDFLGLSESVH